MSDHEDAARYARLTGELLIELRAGSPQGADNSSVGAVADERANRHLLRLLEAEHPDDAVLSEESRDHLRRLGSERVWIVDPLDGTREFTEEGRADWAVHVALWERGSGLTAGAVALPARGCVLGTSEPPTVVERSDQSLRVVASRTRTPDVAYRVAEALGAEVVLLGSAGAKAMSVVLGDADAYVHAGGQYEWDSAAPTVVAVAAGLHASRIDGTPLTYNQPSPWLPDLVVCRPELAQSILDAAAG